MLYYVKIPLYIIDFIPSRIGDAMKVFLTRKIPDEGISILEKQHDVTIFPHDRLPTKKEILKSIKGCDGLLCLLTDPIDADVITAEPHLKMIASYAVGYDNIDIKTATHHGIPVSNTPDVLTDATAELAWALVFAAARGVVKADGFTRAGKFQGWDPLLLRGQQLTGKTLGIIGAGRIGTSFALKSKGFNMPILYYNRSSNTVLEQEMNATKVTLETLLQKADVISLHVPLTKETFHLLGEKQLKMMKPTAILINTSRGPVIDEQALIKALQKEWIFGAGLDVYEQEPTIPQALKKLENVVLQPHTGSATFKARADMAVIAAQNMIAGLAGKQPPNCVNPEVFTA